MVLPDYLYRFIFYILIAILTLITGFIYVNSTNKKIISIKPAGSYTSFIFSSFIAFFLILFIGFRPVSGVFVDMPMYAFAYNNIYDEFASINWSEEWLWQNISYFCKYIGLGEAGYFVVCEILYIVPMFLACCILTPRHVWPAFLMVIASFWFFSYGVNGIRNGVGCSIVFLSVALLTKNNYCKVISILLMLMAYSIHHSTLLPSFCALVSLTFVRETKYAIVFWFISIFISLIAGNVFSDILANAGFDDRTSYFKDIATDEVIEEEAINTGFRFDFLLYSAIPVLFVWYLTIKRNFKDKIYNILANTYILANAFWVIVIRANFSNRFAYLSWFLYPLIIAYPLLRMNIWEDQDRKSALIILAYSGFTLFMYFIYYG